MRVAFRSLTLLLATLCAVAQQAATSVRSVAFTVDRAGGIIVVAHVNGEGPYRFLLDTGSARTVVSASLRERIGAELVASSNMVSAGSSGKATIARLASLSIGVASAPGLDVIVIEDRRLRQAAGAIDGIAGQDFLSRFNYLIDRERGTLIWNPTQAELPTGGVPLRLLAAEGRFLVELPQTNGVDLTMVPDSGADALVLFSSDRALRLQLRPEGGAVRLVSLTASRDVRRVTLARLEIGDEVLRAEPALLVAAAHAGSDGLLPLRGYRQVSFDSRSRTLKLWR